MFSSKDSKKTAPINVDVVETIVGVNSEVTGNISSEGSIRVDGKLLGNVSTKGNLIIGEKGFLEGDTVAKNVVVAGNIVGNIRAIDKVEINKTGALEGDMVAKIVVIEDGAKFTGNCKMENSAQPLLKQSNTETN